MLAVINIYYVFIVILKYEKTTFYGSCFFSAFLFKHEDVSGSLPDSLPDVAYPGDWRGQ